MAKKPYTYSWVEAIAQEMRKNPKLCAIFQLTAPVVTLPTGEIINLEKEFGGAATTQRTIAAPIDEDFNVGVGSGAALIGVPMVVEIPFMAALIPVEHIFSQVAKLRHQTGGQVNMPLVIIADQSGRVPGLAQQHANTGEENVYLSFPGLIVVVPSNAYDAKGLMTTALHQKDPVLYMNYSEVGSSTPVDVPDDQYEIPLAKAAVRQEGKDLTLISWAPATLDVDKALPDIAKAGISLEYIDLRSLKPMDTATIFASAKKTGRLLVVDHSNYTNTFSSHVLSEVAQFVPGVKMRKITFPDAWSPASQEMISWMRPDAPKILDAAKKMMTM